MACCDKCFRLPRAFFLRAATARWFVLLGMSEYEISCLRNASMTRVTVPNCDGVAVCVAVSIDKRWKDCGSIMRGLGGEEDGFWTTGGLVRQGNDGHVGFPGENCF